VSVCGKGGTRGRERLCGIQGCMHVVVIKLNLGHELYCGLL
jgi:hypothetical protein